MAVSVKNLRYQTGQVLKSLARGEKPVITFRGRPVARLIPFTPAEKRSFHDIGFGMWKGRPDMEDVSLWLDQKRKPRFER